MPIFNAPQTTKRQRDETYKAALIYQYSHESASSLLAAYSTSGTGAGAPSNTEQDLLRAMLVMAAAGIDALLKQLIKDCLHSRIEKDKDVRKQFVGYVEKTLEKQGTKFLSGILTSARPHELLREDYIKHLTGDSLQSVGQLYKASSALGVVYLIDKALAERLQKAFDVRNQIIHEMDMNFVTGGRGQRRRNLRRQDEMLDLTDSLLSFGATLIERVDSLL